MVVGEGVVGKEVEGGAKGSGRGRNKRENIRCEGRGCVGSWKNYRREMKGIYCTREVKVVTQGGRVNISIYLITMSIFNINVFRRTCILRM